MLFLLFWNNGYSYERIVSLSPAITDVISYLGEGKKLVGVTIFCSGKVCRGKEKVGGIVNPNVEKIYSLKPDLVISTSLTPRRELELIKKLGVKVLVFRLVSLEDVENVTESLGELFGKRGRGGELLENLKRKASESLSCLKGKRVLILLSTKPLYCAGSGTYLGELLELSGANVVPKGGFKPVSAEEVLRLKPDVVLVIGSKEPEILEKLGLNLVLFSKKDEVLHPSPVLLKGVEDLGREVCAK